MKLKLTGLSSPSSSSSLSASSSPSISPSFSPSFSPSASKPPSPPISPFRLAQSPPLPLLLLSIRLLPILPIFLPSAAPAIQDRATHLITIGHIRASLARPHLPRISMTFIPPLPPLLPQSLPSSLPNPQCHISFPIRSPRSLLHATPPAPLSPLQIQTTLPNLQ
ncbi:unnamed protein product [Closterium sp. NIES-64]|nr:unnamed protein product [Closterium sp. NIES-64]